MKQFSLPFMVHQLQMVLLRNHLHLPCHKLTIAVIPLLRLLMKQILMAHHNFLQHHHKLRIWFCKMSHKFVTLCGWWLHLLWVAKFICTNFETYIFVLISSFISWRVSMQSCLLLFLRFFLPFDLTCFFLLSFIFVCFFLSFPPTRIFFDCTWLFLFYPPALNLTQSIFSFLFLRNVISKRFAWIFASSLIIPLPTFCWCRKRYKIDLKPSEWTCNINRRLGS